MCYYGHQISFNLSRFNDGCRMQHRTELSPAINSDASQNSLEEQDDLLLVLQSLETPPINFPLIPVTADSPTKKRKRVRATRTGKEQQEYKKGYNAGHKAAMTLSYNRKNFHGKSESYIAGYEKAYHNTMLQVHHINTHELNANNTEAEANTLTDATAFKKGKSTGYRAAITGAERRIDFSFIDFPARESYKRGYNTGYDSIPADIKEFMQGRRQGRDSIKRKRKKLIELEDATENFKQGFAVGVAEGRGEKELPALDYIKGKIDGLKSLQKNSMQAPLFVNRSDAYIQGFNDVLQPAKETNTNDEQLNSTDITAAQVDFTDIIESLRDAQVDFTEALMSLSNDTITSPARSPSYLSVYGVFAPPQVNQLAEQQIPSISQEGEGSATSDPAYTSFVSLS